MGVVENKSSFFRTSARVPSRTGHSASMPLAEYEAQGPMPEVARRQALHGGFLATISKPRPIIATTGRRFG